MARIDRIISSVHHLVAKHGTRNPYALCKALGVTVTYLDLHPQLKAYYISRLRCQRIVINSNLEEDVQTVMVAHELGHQQEHREVGGISSFQEFEVFNNVVPAEYEANLFAAELLAEDDRVIELLNDDFSFFRVAKHLGIPPELLDFKFKLLLHKGYRVTPQYLGSSNFLRKL